MMLRRAARAALSTPAADWLVALLERFDRGRSDVLAVLTYHRIAEPASPGAHAALYVSPQRFEEHLDAVTRRYTVVPMEAVLTARSEGRRLPRRALLLTFDDAYLDFATNAWPMLRARGLPATLFVPTGYPDQGGRWFWWDRLGEVLGSAPATASIATPLGDLPIQSPAERDRAYRLLRDHCKHIGLDAANTLVAQIADAVEAPAPRNDVLGWDELRRLAAEGVTMAAHSVSHALLPGLSDEALASELTTSLADVEREIGARSLAFAYPSGAWDQRVVAATDAAGFVAAFTTERGVNDLRNVNWLAMRRINVGHRTGSTLLRAQMGSWMRIVQRD